MHKEEIKKLIVEFEQTKTGYQKELDDLRNNLEDNLKQSESESNNMKEFFEKLKKR